MTTVARPPRAASPRIVRIANRAPSTAASRSEASMTRSRTEVTAYAGLSASVLAVALVLIAPTPWLGLIGALLLACVPAGAAVMCWIDSGEDAAQAGLTLAISLSVLAIVSAIMIWTSAWEPRALLVLAASASSHARSGCALRCRDDRGGLAEAAGEGAADESRRAGGVARAGSGLNCCLEHDSFDRLNLGLAARHRRLDPWRHRSASVGIGLYGLLASANLWFVLAFALLPAGFLVELRATRARLAPRPAAGRPDRRDPRVRPDHLRRHSRIRLGLQAPRDHLGVLDLRAHYRPDQHLPAMAGAVCRSRGDQLAGPRSPRSRLRRGRR